MKISKITEFQANYDVFLLDLYGLMYDEDTMYPGAIEFLQSLKDTGKKVVFISNAPRTSERTAQRLAKFNITPELYHMIYTPGQMFFDDCNNGSMIPVNGKYFAFGSDLQDINYVNNVRSLTRTDNIEEAQCLISFNVFDSEEDNAKIKEMLLVALENNLPMLCLNPDKIVRKHSVAKDVLCAGYVSDMYDKMGGNVVYYGKPYNRIYDRIWDFLGKPDKKQMIAMGDALETDIEGASRFGIDSGLVLTGIHSDCVANGGIVNLDRLEKLIKGYDVFPKYILKNLLP